MEWNMLEHYSSKYQRMLFDLPHPRVLRITLHNPSKLNAVDECLHGELGAVWRDIDADPEVSSVIVTGSGKAFSAGGEFALIEQIANDPQVRARNWKEARDIIYNMLNCSKPIVSAINGSAAGAGLACALLADISIAVKDARLLDGHTRIGVAAGDHAAIIWPLLCGLAKSKYYLLLCEPVTGEEAERIGLVSLAVERAELEDRALKIAIRLAEGAPSAIRWTKYALNNWLRQAGPIFDASLALEFLGFCGNEIKEGVAALVEKRKPNFDPNSPL
jgi:enoyl-CoA hydratase